MRCYAKRLKQADDDDYIVMLLFPYNSFQLALLIFILVGYFRYNKKKYYIFPVESTKKEARFLFLFLWIHCSSST